MNLFIHTVAIRSYTTSQTASGAVNRTYSDRIASLQCLIQGKNLQTTDQLGRDTLVNTYKLYCDYNDTTNAIDESDRVIWGTRTFEITGIKSGGGMTHHLEINMVEIT